MLKLLQSVFGSPDQETNRYDDALIERATERVVDGTDARIRALMSYRKKMRPAIQQAVGYVIDLVDRLPPPVEFSRKQYGVDPRLRALFASPARLREVIGTSQSIRDYVAQNPSSTARMLYAGFGTERQERKVLGMRDTGEMLQRDVEQVVINFGNHRFAAVADNEMAGRWELKKRAFDSLIETALGHISAERTQRDTLAQERQLLRQKLRALREGHWGLHPVLDHDTSGPVELPAIEDRILKIDAELGRIGTKTVNLDDYLGQVTAIMGAPQEHLRMHTITLTLNSMGIKEPEGSQGSVATLQLDELSTSGGRCVIVMPVCIPGDEIPQPSGDLLDNARRYLN